MTNKKKPLRYAGHDNFDLLWVSYTTHAPLNAVVVPSELSNITDKELLANYTVRGETLVQKKSSPKTIVMISDYGINCGIATYTKALCEAMIATGVNLTILAEDAEVTQKDEPHVIRCWHRTENNYSRLLQIVEKIHPDCIYIQHEYGLFPKLDLWNTLLSQLSRWRVVVTLHTVLEHNIPNETIKLDYLCRSLAEASCPEVVVHNPRAPKTLRSRGFSGRIHLIPHGCQTQKLPKLPCTKYNMFSEYSIFQFGFGGRHKGWEFAIETVEKLVSKYPDIIYTGIFNSSPQTDLNKVYFRDLLSLVRQKKLERNVALLYGYQSEEMLKIFIRSSRIALYPYQKPHENWASWGSSGAIHLPLSMGLPTIITDFPMFFEFQNRLPVVKTPEEAAQQIDQIFSDKEYEKKLSDLSFEIVNERNWDKVALLYLNVPPDQDFVTSIGWNLPHD